MTVAPAILDLHHITDVEDATRVRLLGRLRAAQRINERQEAFYEGSKRIRDLGIAIPPHLKDVEAVAAWPEIVVDVIDERMDWRGWSTDDDLGLDDVYDANHLEIEVGQATLDSLIAGLSYLSVGTGGDGEPDVLVKAESPSRMTATWDSRLRRCTEALAENVDGSGRIVGWTLYLPDTTITTKRISGGLAVVDRDDHGLGRIPVAVLRNRPRASRIDGRSEITRAVRSLTESGMRTLLGMEVAREFYGAPQRYLMDADEEMFVGEDGKLKSGWEAVMGRMLVAPRNEDGSSPTPGQFAQASPQPFTEILKTLAQMLSAATGMPATHLGFNTDNPASADAIQQANDRLNKRAVRRQKQYDLGLLELSNIVTLWQYGELPANPVRSLWVDPSPPSLEASATRAGLMIDKGALDPSWDFTLEQFGLSDADILRVQRERRRQGGTAALRAVVAAAEAGVPAVTGGAGDAA